MRRAGRTEERAPTWLRWFVGLFLSAFIVCGAVGIEAWPLTGFRLFSQVRSSHQHTWHAFAVDPEGHERRIAFSGLPTGMHGFTLIMRGFESLSAPQRLSTCRVWADAAHALGIRIYRLDWDLASRHNGRPTTPPVRTLAYECDAATG